MTIRRLGVLVATAAAASFFARAAHATPVCTTVAKFNDDAATKGVVAASGVLKFKVTGVDASAVGKGALASFGDGRSKDPTGGVCVITQLKLFGPSVDLGKVKYEISNVCCKSACDVCGGERSGALACDTWAGEARSAVIFTAATQTCDVELRFGGAPSEQFYSVTCDDGKGDTGLTKNDFQMQVDRVSLLVGVAGWGKMDGTILSEQFCYEPSTTTPADAGADTAVGPTSSTLDVQEDVTAAADSPSTVYPDQNDLTVGATSESFLKFVVPTSVGVVTKATIVITNMGTPSTDGDGGALFTVATNAWSEKTLTWSARPSRGTRLGRVSPVTLGQKVSFDVTSTVVGPGTYSFVMGGEAGDSNDTHFWSKEAPAKAGPVLQLNYLPAVPSDAGSTDAGTDAGGDSTCPTCDGGKSADRSSDSDMSGGCGCVVGGASDHGGAAGWLAALVALLITDRRCSSRGRSPDSRRRSRA